MIDVAPDTMELLSRDAAVQAWHEYVGYLPKINFIVYNQLYKMAGSIVMMACFDAFISTTIPFLFENGSDNIECHS